MSLSCVSLFSGAIVAKSVLTLSRLLEGCCIARESFIKQLTERGFACLCLDDQELLSALEDGLEAAQALDVFRFPPNDDSPTIYDRITRDTFRALFTVSTMCFKALCVDHKVSDYIAHALKALPVSTHSLFSGDTMAHEPFSGDHVFSQSFFNLFNYDHGLLNPHFDRSLVTVIKTLGGQNDDHPQTALWVKSSAGHWSNADRVVRHDEVVIMIGQDCETLSFMADLGLYAAEHAVRVNPAGEYIAHSHFRRDPSTPSKFNRTSAAFILRHEPPPDI
jgi:hypothetical protein